jgi:hypothetical protein
VTSPALKNETFIDMGPLACGLYGAIAMASGPSGCLALQIVR